MSHRMAFWLPGPICGIISGVASKVLGWSFGKGFIFYTILVGVSYVILSVDLSNKLTKQFTRRM